MRLLRGRLVPVIALLVLACAAARPAEAATIDYTVNFGASNFTGFDTPPVGFVLGQFQFSLDIAAGPVVINGPATSNFINLAVGAIGYQYVSFVDTLVVGGSLNGPTGVSGFTDDLFLIIQNFSSSPTFSSFVYSQAGHAIYQSQTGAVHVSSAPPTAVTPIPAALPLFLSALGGMGYLGWRRRKACAA